MKKILFSGLISCGLLPVAAQTNGPSLFAYAEDNTNIIRWCPANEKFVDHYVLQRSDDSVHFAPLHELVSKGPFADAMDNDYEDADPQAGATAWYRLEVVMKDGGSFLSPPIRVDRDIRDKPVIRPTVIHMGGTLRLENYRFGQLLTVNFFNASGTLLASRLVNGTSFTINTGGLPKGILFYRISDENHPLIDAGKLMIL